ncbi:SDR family oxidoreductase [Nonomuraea fuscirosea]|uniref:SDR family NAD(P)-dependent oxidoreductase n=1 Tax=Nonomuraea fuscirosea TaxID=1291556 RepID=UPI002DDC0730|nr:SDR family oxidoreductase [Nonomuraea fuscirosea]WSA56899.1 SDR family oxidoreductase [Nonomuraea fuscirosea]
MRLAKAELENKTVLITGAGSQGGIGADAAELLAEEGARVLVTGRHRERGEQVVKTITAAGGNARFLLADLSKLDDVHRLADEAGEVDVLVNNAAAYALGSSLELTAENYTAMYDTNVRAPFLLVQRLAPAMIARGSGSIINISTIAARGSMPGMSLYGSTKGAIESLTRSWAAEFAPYNVRVNALAPGTINTDNVSAVMGEAWHELEKANPTKRIGRPREISQAVLFLASDRSSYVSGSVMTVDGAFSSVLFQRPPITGLVPS